MNANMLASGDAKKDRAIYYGFARVGGRAWITGRSRACNMPRMKRFGPNYTTKAVKATRSAWDAIGDHGS